MKKATPTTYRVPIMIHRPELVQLRTLGLLVVPKIRVHARANKYHKKVMIGGTRSTHRASLRIVDPLLNE